MDFPDRLIRSPRVMAGICVGSCVITCLSPFSPLTRLPDPQALDNLALGCRLLVSRGLENTEAISLQPHIFCNASLAAGRLALGNMVTPFGSLHRLHFGNRMLALLNLALVFCPGFQQPHKHLPSFSSLIFLVHGRVQIHAVFSMTTASSSNVCPTPTVFGALPLGIPKPPSACAVSSVKWE